MMKPLKALIVEDSEQDADLLLRELQKAGYSPVYRRVETSQAMTDALESEAWDIILSDYVLPTFSGLAAIKLAQQTDPDLPLIVISGQISEDTAVQAMKAGAQDYIIKGNLKRLGPAIERELADAENRRQRRRAEDELERYHANLEQLVQERTTELAASEGRFRALTETSPIAVGVTSLDGIPLYVNRAYEESFGYATKEIMELKDPDFYCNPGDRLTWLSTFREQGFLRDFDVKLKRRDGTLFWAILSATPIIFSGAQAVMGTVIDITKRKKVEEELHRYREHLEELVEERTTALAKSNSSLQRELTRRKRAEAKTQELSHRLINAHEEERRAVGRELHDQVGGSLTAIKLAVHRTRQQHNNTANTFLDLDGMLNELLDEIRTLSQTLRPSVLDDLGLLEALLWYIQRYTEKTGIRVELFHSGINQRFSPEIETAAYRIIQECLTNVARYARVDNTEVQLFATSTRFNIIVEDRGKGFDPTQVRAEANGLSGMKDRVYLLGGKINIDSSLRSGTTITCWFPLKGKAYKKTAHQDSSTTPAG